MCLGDNVRVHPPHALTCFPTSNDLQVTWYIYSYGVFNDGFHVFHPHGNNVKNVIGENVAAAILLPSTMSVMQMVRRTNSLYACR